jgi:hypothetical protein
MTRPALAWLVWLLAYAYARFRPRHTFHLGVAPYLTRYYLTGTGPTAANNQATGEPGWYLHHIHEPDADRRLHNHPWTWARYWIRRGGYVELRRYHVDADDPPHSTRVRTVGPGDRLGLSRYVYHRIASVQPRTWSLFHAGPKHGRGWGFLE